MSPQNDSTSSSSQSNPVYLLYDKKNNETTFTPYPLANPIAQTSDICMGDGISMAQDCPSVTAELLLRHLKTKLN